MTTSALAKHIADLKAKELSKPKADDAMVFWGTSLDEPYLIHLKPCVGSSTIFLRLEAVSSLSQVLVYCHSKKINRVLTSSVSLLKHLLHWDKKAAPSLDSYAGSYFSVPAVSGAERIDFIILPPLKQLITVPYGKFLFKRFISKFTSPDSWYKPAPFGWFMLTPEHEADFFSSFQTASIIAIDIETVRENTAIRCLSYSALLPDSSCLSVVLPLDSMFAVSIMRKWNWELKAPKVFQNGKYDIAYFCRYSAPVYNYLFDTAHLFHCIYSELPKDLGFLNSFYMREAFYWKDLAETNDLYEYYRYNALDTWGTLNTFLAMLSEAPDYAITNYLLEFPLVFPCHLSEMTGIRRDMDRLVSAQQQLETMIESENASLQKMLATPNFNTNSPKQMKQLLHILGCKDLESTDEKNLVKAKSRHPLNSRIINKILSIRKNRKSVSTYLTPGKEFKGRILYALNPHGTDSSRLASREHHFWCGLNIQNIPRGKIVKNTFAADPGFIMAEADLEQAESRDTAYISGDERLIDNVELSPDFHSSNAACFFGVPFDQIYDVDAGKTIDKALRDLAKRVNHGANYNMGPGVLIDTMGEENIYRAKAMLGLPKMWIAKQVAEYLLAQFHKTYPKIEGSLYRGVRTEIMRTKMLRSMAHHYCSELQNYVAGDAWTRYCFGDPETSKSALNSYISHPPQSLNAQTLNRAYLKVFYEIALNPKYSSNFKLCAQIHDSILFQYREGHAYLCDMVKERMEIPVTIKGYDNITRTFTVPASVKSGDGTAKYWSETE